MAETVKATEANFMDLVNQLITVIFEFEIN